MRSMCGADAGAGDTAGNSDAPSSSSSSSSDPAGSGGTSVPRASPPSATLPYTIACIAGGVLLLVGAGFCLYMRRRAGALRKTHGQPTAPVIQMTAVFLDPQSLPSETSSVTCAHPATALPSGGESGQKGRNTRTRGVATGQVVSPGTLTAVKGVVVRPEAAVLVPSAEAPVQAKPEALEERGRSCVVCLERLAVMALLPCGHRCVCARCYDGGALRGVCPICRAAVESAVRVFDS
ncbi:hypothetical protein T484DRAFT_1801914 [Baffinella frigidus]|nr:hypothetical protein T484DRAFT_1801914 [Cryptophyta sp. CCMP2293]